MFQSPPKEAFSGFPISSASHQNIDHVSILIDGSPKIAALASDINEQFVNMPDVPEPSPLPSQISSIGRTEFQAPIPNSLVRNKDPSLSK